jgi:hypothetical protein
MALLAGPELTVTGTVLATVVGVVVVVLLEPPPQAGINIRPARTAALPSHKHDATLRILRSGKRSNSEVED